MDNHIKKIIVIINNMGIGGAEHHVLDWINEVYKRGIDVYLITLAPEPNNSFLDRINLSKEKHFMVRVAKPHHFKDIWKLRNIIKNINPDILITHSWYANTIGRVAGFLARVSNIISVEHNINIEKSWKQKMADFILQFVSNKIVAVSYTVKKSLVRYFILKNKIVVIYVSIDLNKLKITADYDVREKYGLPKNEFIFLFAGSLTFQKNVFNIIKAFHKTNRGILVIVGLGRDLKALKILVEELNIQNKVFFIGVIHDLHLLMKCSNAFIFTTRWEGLGLVVAEAILSSLAPIISKNTACEEMVSHMHNGLVVENCLDIDQIANAMIKIHDDVDLRNKLVSNCGKICFDISIENNVNQFLKLK